MKRLLLIVSILLLVGGAGGAMADENPPPAKTTAQASAPSLPDLQVNAGDLVALGPLTPGKLREVCAIVGFTPAVKPPMIGIFCYPSTKRGTPARNGYINIFLSWGKLTAPGDGRWTGAKKIDPWRGDLKFILSSRRSSNKGWTFWPPPEALPLWEKYPVSTWPQPVFSKSQLAGQITKVVSGDPTQGFAAGQQIGLGADGPLRTISCGYVLLIPGAVGGWPDRRRGEAICSAGNLGLKWPYPYQLYFSEPWGDSEVWADRYDPTCGCAK